MYEREREKKCVREIRTRPRSPTHTYTVFTTVAPENHRKLVCVLVRRFSLSRSLPFSLPLSHTLSPPLFHRGDENGDGEGKILCD